MRFSFLKLNFRFKKLLSKIVNFNLILIFKNERPSIEDFDLLKEVNVQLNSCLGERSILLKQHEKDAHKYINELTDEKNEEIYMLKSFNTSLEKEKKRS